MNKCKVIISGKECEKKAKYIVRHREHPKNKSFFVCKNCISAYKFKIHPKAEGNFIIKEIKK